MTTDDASVSYETAARLRVAVARLARQLRPAMDADDAAFLLEPREVAADRRRGGIELQLEVAIGHEALRAQRIEDQPFAFCRMHRSVVS